MDCNVHWKVEYFGIKGVKAIFFDNMKSNHFLILMEIAFSLKADYLWTFNQKVITITHCQILPEKLKTLKKQGKNFR